MTNELLKILGKYFTLEKLDTGEFTNIKVGPMKNHINQYYIKGVGNLSIMKGKAMMGLMKMDTVIINPLEVDAPIFSYDRILAMGNDTIYLEMYSTQVEDIDVTSLANVKEKYKDLPNHSVAPNWYDDIRYKESVYKKGKKDNKENFENMIKDYFEGYASVLSSAKSVDLAAKKGKSIYYVNGLLTHGGPSTNVFVKKFGKEKTTELFEKVLFNVK